MKERGHAWNRLVDTLKNYFGAVLGILCCAQVFCSCSEQGLLPSCSVQTSHCGSLFCCGVWEQLVMAHGLSCFGACRIFLDQELNQCPSIARWILNHWTTRKAWLIMFKPGLWIYVYLCMCVCVCVCVCLPQSRIQPGPPIVEAESSPSGLPVSSLLLYIIKVYILFEEQQKRNP